MGFNLWLAREEEISRYYLGRTHGQVYGQIMLGDDPDVFPLVLTIDGEAKDDFTLDEIDSFLCSFKNSDDVRKAFRKYPDYKDIADRAGSLTIASSDNDIGKFRIVYDSPFLKRCADTVRAKRKRGESPFLEDTPEMREFVERILSYAVDENAKYSLLSFQLLIPPVKEALRKYGYSASQNNPECSLQFSESFFKSCLNYKVTRAFVIWEQGYLATKVNKNSSPRVRRGENDITKAREALKKSEWFRLAPVTEGSAAEYTDTFLRTDDGVDLDKVYSLFDRGDFSTADMKKLGLLPPDYSDKVSGKRGQGKK